MRRVIEFRYDTHRYILSDDPNSARGRSGGTEILGIHARRILRAALDERWNAGLADALRGFARPGMTEAHASFARALELVADPIHPLRLYRLPRPSLDERLAPELEAEVDEPESSSEIVDRTWIELCFTDHEGQPLAQLAYTLVLPDGRSLSGVSDGEGLARHDDIPPGSCQVSVDGHDRSNWTLGG